MKRLLFVLLPLIALAAATCSVPARVTPPNLEATGYDSHVELQWQKVDRAQLYMVYRGGTHRATTTDTRLLDFVGPEGRNATHSYHVVALDSKGRNVAETPATTATVRDFSDDQLLEMVQRYTLRYFWEFGDPVSGMALERSNDTRANCVTTGGTGFGIAAIIAGVQNGFIARADAVERLLKIVGSLERFDRFHGAWAHWYNSATGKPYHFSAKDNGGDLVETAFLIQGLLAAQGYFDSADASETGLRQRIETLWRQVEWNHYTKGENALYWHWSPDYEFAMNHQIKGYDECLITYILAASSPTYPISKQVYDQCWVNPKDGEFFCNTSFYDITLPLGKREQMGGPLFWVHYSWIGLCPKGLSDQYADYWEQNRRYTMVDRAYCIDNPMKWNGYGPGLWGLTASDALPTGYRAHSPGPGLDTGTIAPTGALSSMPYTPAESMEVLKNLYRNHGSVAFGPMGFYDAVNFSVSGKQSTESYLAIDQGPIVAMIENHRSGAIWHAFMKKNDIHNGLAKLGFTTTATNDRRVDSLMKQMTLDEKIGQLVLYTSHFTVTGPSLPQNVEQAIRNGTCGNIFNAHVPEYNRGLQKIAVEQTRLGIPLLFGYDVIHGMHTIFPINLGMSCSWDMAAIENSARVAAREAIASGVNWTYSPMVDVTRDPRWGRVSEGSGEDPFLGSKIAAAMVHGYQGDNLADPLTLAACVKHFAAYGAPQAGRDYHTVDMSQRTLRDTYLPPYRAAIDAGVATVMTAFNDVDATPATANRWLMNDVLRGEWGFDGFVVTDYTAINELVPHGVARDLKHAGQLAISAGVNMDMEGDVYHKHLKTLVEEGSVSPEQIDKMCRQVLRVKFDLGLFDDPYRYLDPTLAATEPYKAENRAAARDMARRSMVLLKNDNGALPIAPGARIALTGPLADSRVDLLGSWSGQGRADSVTSIVDGMRARFGNRAVTHTSGSTIEGSTIEGDAAAATAASRRADVTVMVVGHPGKWSGEATSLSFITIPQVQRDLIARVRKTAKKLVLVVLSGRPLDLSWESTVADAIIAAWYPGTEGGHALADILSGDFNPSAKLTMTFPRTIGQIPIHYDMKNTGRPYTPGVGEQHYVSRYLDLPTNDPLYPFGWGLSYTTFEYSDLRLSNSVMNGSLTVSATVTNTGKRAGDEIAQLYIRDVVGSVTRPVKMLRGFERLTLAPGESKRVTFNITDDDVSFHRADMTLGTEPGEFQVWVGGSSQATLVGSFYGDFKKSKILRYAPSVKCSCTSSTLRFSLSRKPCLLNF
jgi:beta-glucosidase